MLEAVDYILLLAVLIVSLGIGFYHSRTGGHQNTVAEFILDNRQLQVLPTVLSFTASFQSAIAVMYAPVEYYQWGAQLWLIGNTSLILTLLFIERLIVPVFYKLNLTSIYDYFEIRYQSKAVRCLASLLGVLYVLLYSAVTVLGVSVALETMTDLPFQAGIAIMVACCAIYTALGGMRAVIWTDVLQIVVMITGLLVFLILGANEVGGLAKAIDTGHSTGRIYTRFDIDPRIRTTFWGAFATSQCLGLYNFGFSQAAMQRYVALPSLSKARLMTLIVWPFNFLFFSLCTLIGVCVLSFFMGLECDPFKSGVLTSPNQLLPFFVKILFTNKSGGKGLLLAVVYSASLSTVSSSLSGCAANIWEDLIKTMIPGVTERRSTLAIRLLVVILAILTTGLALVATYIPGNLMQIFSTITGCVFGPLLGMFLLALCSKCSEWRGAVIGCVVGALLTAWLSLGSLFFPNRTQPLPPPSTEGCGIFLANYSCTQYGNISALNADLNYLNATLIDRYAPKGIQNVHTISHLWFIPIAVSITYIVGYFSSKVLCSILNFTHPNVERDHLIYFRDLLNIDGWPELWKKEQNRDKIEIETKEVLFVPDTKKIGK